ncbi:MAG: acetamidase/formamidase family protein [Chloroflexi bacterium]|nr:acetamidase/formamidase family protein [Chloroflexota bacterium]
MLRIPRDQLTYEFSAASKPVASVAPGDQFVVETHDTSTGRVHRAEDMPEFVRVRDPLRVNPAAGPVFVEGASPGDDLIVEILDIRLQPYGFVRVIAGAGVLQDGIEPDGVLMARVDGEHVVLGERVRMPVRPMVGVIGTAPADGVVYTAAPGPQGSNIDVNAVTVGSRVHLPVHVEGALLAIGDVHASMGDGEVSGTGIEIAGEVTVQVDVEPRAAAARPWIETDSDWITTGSGPSLEDAVEMAVDELVQRLMRHLGLSRTEAFLLVSARGDVRIGQCARIRGLDTTAYVVFPKTVERLNS